MTTLKEGDFIEIQYTGRLKGTNEVFDTTDEAVAKANHLHNTKIQYGPLIICIGQKEVLKGLDAQLVGKEIGKSYKVELEPENAFGKKQAKLVQLMSKRKFAQNKIQPFVGLQVNIDGTLGIIKTVSGGRILVDFNHPISGKAVLYDLKINRLVTDNKERIQAMVDLLARQKPEVEIKDKIVTVKTKHPLPPPLQMLLKMKIKKTMDLEAEFSQ